MCRALIDSGHQPEVFVTSDRDETVTVDGVIVHRVDPAKWRARLGSISRMAKLLPRGGWAAERTTELLGDAAALCKPPGRRARQVTFDCVQSPHYRAAGFFVPRRRSRPHVVRCSGISDLWGFDRWQALWERRAIRRADRVCAPSRFVAVHMSTTLGLPVDVV